ncbi:glycogen debranching protein [Streptomyces sp. SID1328]|uniref:glycogen debranching protein n=1 Tax=Streptomyces sp. SID1328 TaxID=2690250 RepID=UPI001367AD2E|nr:alpha-amylase family glycosyl hydrolase [Streptomyces sp. SID1328]MYV39595.1 glycogen debranching protein [Streptomyces sp. SID1328]
MATPELLPRAAWRTSPGRARPLGASPVPGGVNFALHAREARAMWLVLMDAADGTPLAELPFPDSGRFGTLFTVTVQGLNPARFHYGYRVEYTSGELSPVLLDPYATELAGTRGWGARPQYRCAVPTDDFDWGDDRPLGIPQDELIIYETHLRGFTRHTSSAVASPGTYAGLREKIPYLRHLGVNCVELLPVFEFDETDNTYVSPTTGEPLRNFWGYNSVSFFAPKADYASETGPGGPAQELKSLVKSLHAAGIAVVLDVVFNHTAEGDHRGPTISLRGLDESAYYLLDSRGRPVNLTATGNTVNCNHPVTRALILDSLRHWATEYHVDGFRFDMAAVLTRGTDGLPLSAPPLIEAIAHDPALAHCVLIAEATDAAGAYQVGSFPAYGRWSEWNMRYRDAIRRFLLGRPGSAGEFATRLVGSPDLYPGRGATPSVNYVTCHDGFTLADWTTYDRRHNEANGEDGQDGIPDEDSWNCGHEGPTDDPVVLRLRVQQARNALLLLLASQGVPMLLAGDEFGRTQHGNNNAYGQDGPLGWVDWDQRASHGGLLDFTRRTIALRKAHPVLRRVAHPDGNGRPGAPCPPVSWHGEEPWQPDWASTSTLLAAMLYEEREDGPADCVYLAANSGDSPRNLCLPEPPPGLRWHVFADTGSPAHQDGHEEGEEPVCSVTHWCLAAHASLLLVAGPARHAAGA